MVFLSNIYFFLFEKNNAIGIGIGIVVLVLALFHFFYIVSDKILSLYDSAE